MVTLANRIAETGESPTMATTRRVAELRRAGRPIISLIAGEPEFTTPEPVKAAAVAALARNDTKYTASEGIDALRKAVAVKLRDENGLDYDASQIVLAAGTKPLLHAAFLALTDPGDEIIIPAPFWVSHPDIARLVGAVPVHPRTGPDTGFRLTPAALEAALTPRSRVLLLNTPNNPTGALYDVDELSALYEVLKRHPRITVVTDEIYEHFIFGGQKLVSPAATGAGALARTVTINGFSKGYAMTGWRLGFAAGPLSVIRAISDILGHLLGSPNTISQYAALEALRGEHEYRSERRADLERRRALALSLVGQIPDLVVENATDTRIGSFFLYVNVEKLIGRRDPAGKVIATDTDLVDAALEHADVLLVPGSVFGLSPYIRISYVGPEAELVEGLGRLRSFVGHLD
ncbi:pyridoxal phosphate-dependent aminotransferase [Paenirhodobacter populi]|nr:pyridoxal phosphate-dependent aminotransferase [Sinirhodobacter populi]